MDKVKTYITESWDEIKNKVTWSKYSELQGSAILVLVASTIFALLLELSTGFLRLVLNGFIENFKMQKVMAELKWYVLRVVSGQEKKVKSYLETEIERSKLTDFIPQVLIPSEKVYEMRNGKKRVRERNSFRVMFLFPPISPMEKHITQ